MFKVMNEDGFPAVIIMEFYLKMSLLCIYIASYRTYNYIRIKCYIAKVNVRYRYVAVMFHQFICSQ